MWSYILEIDITITDGLRFSFEQEDQHVSSGSDEEDCLPTVSNQNAPTVPVAALHDLDRLLQLSQTGDVETEEYQLLKSRILLQMSLSFQCISLPKTSHPVLLLA
jgi:hypothetical protein